MVIAYLVLTLLLIIVPDQSVRARSCKYVGVNLGSPNYYEGNLTFVNLFKQAGSRSCRCSDWSGNCTTVSYDPDGYPTDVGPCDDGTGVGVPVIYMHGGPAYDPEIPSSQYYASCEGGGSINIGATTINCPATNVPVTLSSGGVTGVDFVSVSPSAYPKNIVVIPPGGVCGTSYTSYKHKTYCTSDSDCTAPDVCILFTDFQQNSPSNLPTFWPVFLSELDNFAWIRFMDWMGTNNHQGVCINNPNQKPCDGDRYGTVADCGLNGPCVSRWVDRKKVTAAQYNSTIPPSNVPLEIQAELCNILKKDCWFNIPHLADLDYAYNMGVLLKSSLDPDINLMVEYSNEVWNSMFAQFHWITNGHCTSDGSICSSDSECTSGTCDTSIHYDCPNTGGCNTYQEYTARGMELFEEFSKGFNDDSRIIFVIGTQVANPWVTSQIANYVHPTLGAFRYYKGSSTAPGDAMTMIGIAPYMGGLANEVNVQEDVARAWYKNIYGYCSVTTTIQCKSDADCPATETCKGITSLIRPNISETDPLGLRLIMYEGGNHIICSDSPNPTECIDGMNHPAGELPYREYYEKLNSLGVYGLVHFSFVYYRNTNQWMSWGLKWWTGQPDSEASKWRGILKYIEKCGVRTSKGASFN